MENRKKKLNTLSLFAGGGGLDLGFSAAGFDILVSTDIDEYSCKTLKLNQGKKNYLKRSVVVPTDIHKLTTKELLSAAEIEKGEVDVIIGGPPCQAFSVFGKRKGTDDPRGNLVWEFLKKIREIEPTAFVFENVAGLKTIHNGKLYQEILESLSLNGLYTVSDHNYELADFGIPQFRNRILFIGVKNGKRVPPMTPSHGPHELFDRLPYVTVEHVLKNMPEPNSSIANHRGREHGYQIIKRYTGLKYGQRDTKTRINKLHPHRPSFTIVVGSDAGGGKGHVHPYTPREVTPRESARLQTFPDWWEFFGTGRHVIRQVGNAVPPLFAALLAEHIKKFVFNKKSSLTYNDFLDKLGLNFIPHIYD